jgi:hypothetical protein
VRAAIDAMRPFTAQLGGRSITAFGHTIANVVALGEAQAGLEAWVNQTGDDDNWRRADRAAQVFQATAGREPYAIGICLGCGKEAPLGWSGGINEMPLQLRCFWCFRDGDKRP